MNRTHVSFALAVFAVAGALFFQLGCGGEESPTDVTALPTPRPVAAATAPPAPTATPVPSELCPNGNWPVASFDIKVYTVKKPNGDFREDFHQNGPFYVGEKLRMDSQGKDKFGRRTNGCNEPRWDWYDDSCGMLNADRGWQPVVDVLDECEFTIEANHDHKAARENPFKLKFLPKASAPY